MENGEQAGPFSLEELESYAIELDTKVLTSFSSQWMPAAEVPELTGYFYAKGIYIASIDTMAGFWWRLMAYVIDYFVLVVVMIIGLNIFPIAINTDPGNIGLNLASVALLIVYNTICEVTAMRGSVGKYLCRLAVVNELGMKETFRQALMRNLGKILSSLVLGLGYLYIFWSPFQQGWHDEMAHTYVIRKPENLR